MKTTQTVYFDVDKKPYTEISAKQGDSGSRFIEFHLTRNSSPLDLTGNNIYIYIKKPDDTEVFNVCTINDAVYGIVTAELTSQALAASGTLYCELEFVGADNSKYSSTVFTIDVLDSPFDDNIVESSNEFSALIDALSKVQNLSSGNNISELSTTAKIGSYNDLIDNKTVTVNSSGTIDLSGYAKESELSDYAKVVDLDNKVDKIPGKQLSTEDYTEEEKDKLAGIEVNANHYVHPDTHPASMIIEDSSHKFISDDKIILKSPSGKLYRISVDDNGVLQITLNDNTGGMLVVTSINSIQDIGVQNGTQLSDVGLPGKVTIVMSDGSQRQVPVTWDGGTPAYNSIVAGTYVFKGTISASSLNAAVNVIVTSATVTVNDVVATGTFSTTKVNYIQSNHNVTLDRTTFMNLISAFDSPQAAFTGDGQITVSGMPWAPKSGYPQASAYVKDLSDSIIMSQVLPNDAIPYGANVVQQVSGWYNYVTIASDRNLLTPWGQIFAKDPKNTINAGTWNSYGTSAWDLNNLNGYHVYLDNLTLCVYRKSAKRWLIMCTSKGNGIKINGQWYDSDFSDGPEGMMPIMNANIQTTTNGLMLTIDTRLNLTKRVFHFFPLGENNDGDGTGYRYHLNSIYPSNVYINPADIAYVVAYVDVWTDAPAHTLVCNMGCDAYNARWNDQEVGGGRMVYIPNGKANAKRVYFTNLAYAPSGQANSYFDYCNPAVINNLI